MPEQPATGAGVVEAQHCCETPAAVVIDAQFSECAFSRVLYASACRLVSFVRAIYYLSRLSGCFVVDAVPLAAVALSGSVY